MFYFLIPLLLFCAKPGYALEPQEILERADDIRSPSESFIMTVEVATGPDRSLFEVAIKGKDKTMIRTLEPAREKGRNLLMLGDEMWAYLPDLKRAIRVSLSQKLTGEAANGDIARARWAGDYDAKLQSEDAKSWTLFLTAKRTGLTYDKARIVIEKNSFHPLLAEYLTLDQSILKRAFFDDYRSLAGGIRPGRIVIRDAARQNRESIMTLISMEKKALADAEFLQSSLAP